VGGTPVTRSSAPPFAGSEHLGGNGVDLVDGEIRQEARFRQHCGGDGSRVVVCRHPAESRPPLNPPLAASISQQFVNRM
jgi:hypothetical protein